MPHKRNPWRCMISMVGGPRRPLPGLFAALPDGLSGLSPADEPVRSYPQGEQEPADAGARETAADEPEPIGNQPAIWDAEPEPRQLALLPEPEPWEVDRPIPAGAAGARGGRLARRRSRTAPPPDQLSLF